MHRLTSLRRLTLSAALRQQQLRLTDRAVAKLKQISGDGEHLRVLVDSGGCSGFEYKLSLDRERRDDDQVVEQDGAKVVVDKVIGLASTLKQTIASMFRCPWSS